MFLQSRTYGGYATTNENPDPYAYEYGFATKWLIQAQSNQLSGGGIDKIANLLMAFYTTSPYAAPWFN